VLLSNGRKYGCDFVVSATGVDANVDLALGHGGRGPVVEIDAAGGIRVDESMQSSDPAIYAAGDACSVVLDTDARQGKADAGEVDEERCWFQMRLWSQAHAQVPPP